jgi:tetratricopeptide (TPR) repeat protein
MKALETTKESYYWNWAGADAAYARAFAGRGLDVTGPGEAAALERIRRSPVKARLVTALDAWADAKRNAGAKGWEELLAAAGRADDSGDEARRRLREAALQQDTGRLLALAGDSGLADWPPADAVLLAQSLWAAEERGAAERVLRVARVQNASDFWINANLGQILGYSSAASRDEGIGFLRAAVAARPRAATAHYNLGHLLDHQGREAEAEYREAIRFNPDYPEAHCNLGLLLRGQGRFREALEELRLGHELGSRDPRWPHPSPAWVLDCQRLAELDALLPSVLAGAAAAADADAALGFARVCHYSKRHAAAARFSAEALAAGPSSPDAVYNAACSAVLAGCGNGDDAPAAEAERVRLRAQALAWMQADLAFWKRIADGGDPKAVAAAQRNLGHWRKDPDLAGVRDADALEKLPAAERTDWRKPWADVDALLQKASPEAK